MPKHFLDRLDKLLAAQDALRAAGMDDSAVMREFEKELDKPGVVDALNRRLNIKIEGMIERGEVEG